MRISDWSSDVCSADLLLWVGNVFAQTDYDGRWYVSPSLGAVFSDKNDLDSGFAGSLAVGRSIAPTLGLELEGGYSYLDATDLTNQHDYHPTSPTPPARAVGTSCVSTCRPCGLPYN